MEYETIENKSESTACITATPSMVAISTAIKINQTGRAVIKLTNIIFFYYRKKRLPISFHCARLSSLE